MHTTPLKVRTTKLSKLHARPSLQYRYEHYDPYFTA
jgi:hypothetical protein